MKTWLEYLAARMAESAGDLDPNDPATKAILNDPQLITAFQKNPAKAALDRKTAEEIVKLSKQRRKDPTVVAKAANVAAKSGMTTP